MLALPDIRPATPTQARAVAELSRDTIEFGLSWSWTEERVRQAIGDPAVNVAVASRQHQLVGFGIMQYGDDTAHLVLLAVAPLLRHQGLGRQLLDWLERSARVAGARIIRLECRADNRNAIAFYRRLGYRQADRVTGYYEGKVDAVKMHKAWP